MDAANARLSVPSVVRHPGSQRWLRVARKHQPMPRAPTFDPGGERAEPSRRARTLVAQDGPSRKRELAPVAGQKANDAAGHRAAGAADGSPQPRGNREGWFPGRMGPRRSRGPQASPRAAAATVAFVSKPERIPLRLVVAPVRQSPQTIALVA